MQFSIQKLGSADAEDYRALRLDGLARHPEAFCASFEEEDGLSIAAFAERLEGGLVFGARACDRDVLLGTVGLRVSKDIKTRHRGLIWGMYVVPDAQGTGIGAALLRHVMEESRHRVEQLYLAVAASNVSAQRLYGKAGFKQYGLERRAMKVGAIYHDLILMDVRLEP